VSLHGTAQNVEVLIFLNVKMRRRFVAGRREVFDNTHLFVVIRSADQDMGISAIYV
jgi:hypothetical protein